jgi:2-polyprenylphenol hydroxylase and related flavodoxin oxidoreductases
MGEKHTVKFDPVDLEMEVDEDETILDAAFRQGIALMHGCREGQCAACKSFLIEGDAQMDKYSTFALADYESDEGYVLLCKCHAYSDLTVELINYDEEALRNAVPLQHLRTRVAAIDAVTHDIVSLRLELITPESFAFKPGQYADILLPDGSGHRSFSMAMTPTSSATLEFLIKKYPGGLFSGLLEDGLKVGDELELDGPYGSFTLREASKRRVVCIGGGAGMAPILSLLRHMAEAGVDRPVTFYYGARNLSDLFYLDEISRLGERLTDFRFVPCLSDTWPDDWSAVGVQGESGLVTDVFDRLETGVADCDHYLCGPPPMVDAAIALLEANDVPREQIHYDKFTTSVTG